MRLEKIIVPFLILISSFAYSKKVEKTKISREIGLALIEPLLEGRKETTTTLRMENKNILEQSLVHRFLDPLLKKTSSSNVKFNLRNPELKNTKSLTTTIYGKKLYFRNGPLKTNIKLRARVYSTLGKTGEYKRIKLLKNIFFLELKVKNAHPNELNVSRKYRFLITDEDLNKLYKADPNSPSFGEDLNFLEKAFTDSNPKKTKEEIQKFISTIKKASLIDEEFLKPLFVIEYSRTGYKFLETYKTRRLTRKKREKEIEYQITLDKGVEAYKINQDSFFSQSIDSYLKNSIKQDLIYKYDDKLCVIEFKAPLSGRDQSYQKHSKVFKEIQRRFFSPLFEKTKASGDYERDKGKLASSYQIMRKKQELN